MEIFLIDLLENIKSYYAQLIAITPRLMVGLLVFFFIFLLAIWSKKNTKKVLQKRMDDVLLAVFLAQAVKVSIVIVGLLIFLNIVGLGKAATGLLAGVGVSAFIIGFALKDIGENFLAGFIMAFNRPFRVGDVIDVTGIKGVITSMNLRETMVKTFDGKDVYIPNGQILKNPLTNYTIDGFLRNDFKVALYRGSDVDRAMEILLKELKNTPGVLLDEKPPFLGVSGLGSGTINLQLFYWIDTDDPNVSGLKVKTEAITRCLNALEQAGYDLPSDIIELKQDKTNAYAGNDFQNKEKDEKIKN